jgi:N-acetylmuramoyl-L-alanine amidase
MQPYRSSRRSLVAVAVLLAALLVTFLGVPGAWAATAPLVFIDAGHGGPYSNANEGGLYEKDVNLLIGLELQRQLEARGYRTLIDRSTDTALSLTDIPTWHDWDDGYHLYRDGQLSSVPVDDLQARDNIANAAGADIFVSIHCNGVGSSGPSGTETWSSPNDALGARLASVVQSGAVAAAGTVDRGAKSTGFYVIRWANMPAALVEAGFLSNPAEALRMGSPVWRMVLASGIADGVDAFFASNPFTARFTRVAGADRYDTAAQLSHRAWPSGAKKVLLASGTTWPDAVAASPLSRALDAPLLLTEPDRLPSATRAEIARLHPAEVIVLGGPSSVATAVADDATGTAKVGTATVLSRRIGGANRYETSALIAGEVGVPADGRIAIASGSDWFDAVCLSPFVGRSRVPMLLTSGSSLAPATAAFIGAHRASIKKVVVVGGEAAVPTKALAGLPAPLRLVGPDKWSTNAAVNAAWGSGTLTPFVASGTSFPDAIAAGAAGAKTGQPLVLVPARILPDRAREWIGWNAARTTGFTIVGGTSSVPWLTEAELDKARR